MAQAISQRLGKLRKHLSDRLQRELTHADLSEMTGLSVAMIQRMESSLKGNTQTLVTLLNFYRSHNYNADWILDPNNSQIPMMIPPVNELQAISSDMANFCEMLQDSYTGLNQRLRNMGYQPLERKRAVESVTELPEPVGLEI